jgi:putative transposase
MKINRSSKCSLKFLNKNKKILLEKIIIEYSSCVNVFISKLNKTDKPSILVKSFLKHCENSWLSQRLLQNAAREALDMVKSAKDNKKPIHNAKRMCLNANICQFGESSQEFDLWLKLRSIGNKEKLNIPLKKHIHFNRLNEKGSLLNYFIITKNYVQFSFEIETGPKKEVKSVIGIDTGIKHLASLSNGEHIGSDIEDIIKQINNKQHGSKGQQRKRLHLKQRIGEVAKEICKSYDLVVVERLTNITKGTKVKRRLTKNIRRVLGASNINYWLRRLQMTCEEMNVSFRTVLPFYTSQRCNACGHTEKKNRSTQDKFLCQSCGHSDNADINAAKNILERFITGKYGSCYKPLYLSIK